jgi:hypothetical protein
MTNADLVKDLEAEWELETGFLGRLRQGTLDRDGARRLLELLDALPTDGSDLPHRVVALVWMIPVFLLWQRERLAGDADAREIEDLCNRCVDRLQRVLGAP